VVESFRSRGVWEWVAPQRASDRRHRFASNAARIGVGQGATGYIASIANVLAGAEAINEQCLAESDSAE